MRRLTLPLLLALLLAGCVRQSQAPAATAPAATPAPPPSPAATERPAPQPPTATPAPDDAAAIRAGLARTAALDHYQMLLVVDSGLPPDSFSSPFHPQGSAPAGHQPSREEYIYTRASERAAVWGYRPRLPGSVWRPMAPQLLRDGEQHYVSGPLPLPGMGERIWYSLGATPPAGLRLPPGLAEAVPLLTDGLALEEFWLIGTQQLFGADCRTYQGDRYAGARMLEAAGVAPGTLDIEPADGVELRYQPRWIGAQISLCDDGVVRRVQAAAELLFDPDLGIAPLVLGVDLVVRESGPAVAVAPPAQAATRPIYPEAGTAFVVNGGNVRAVPVSGEPQDQMHAGETVGLYGKSSDGAWYLLVTPRGSSGWASVTLLQIDPAVAAAVPVLEGFSTAPLGLAAAQEPTPLPVAAEYAVTAPTPEPLSTPAPPTTRDFDIGPIRLIAPVSYAGGDLLNDREGVLAEMRALGGTFERGADQFAASGLPARLLIYDRTLGPSGVVTNITAVQSGLPPGMSVDAFVKQSVASFPPEVRYIGGANVALFDGRYIIETRMSAGGAEVAQYIVVHPSLIVHDDGRREMTVWLVTFTTGASEWEQRRPELWHMAENVLIR